MSRVYAKPRNGDFLHFPASGTRSFDTVDLKADDVPYEAGTVLIDETDAEGDLTGLYIRASEATAPQIAAAKVAVILSNRTYAETTKSVLVVARHAEVIGKLLDSTANADVVTKLTDAGIVLR